MTDHKEAALQSADELQSPEQRNHSKRTGIGIAKSAVRLRRGPSLSSEVLAVIPAGAAVQILQTRSDGFYSVAYGNMNGYSATPYIVSTSGVTVLKSTPCSVADITGGGRVRESASVQASAAFLLQASAPLTIIGFTRTGWALITSGNRAGFMWGGLLQPCTTLPFVLRRQGDLSVVVYNGRILRPS